MLHRFSFIDGRVSYANRFLETRAYAAARDEGRIAYPEFATDPCRSLFARAMSVFDPQVTDSAKVSIARVAERYLALAETPIQVQFDPETLRTVGVVGWDTSTFGRMTTVHPHLDEARHEAINLVTRFGATSHYVLRRIDTERSRARPRRHGCHPTGPRTRIHPLVRHVREAPGDRRVPLRGQPDGPAPVAQAVHRELPLGAAAGHPVPHLRPGHRRPRAHRHHARLLRVPPRQRLRVRRRPRGGPRRLRRCLDHRGLLPAPARGARRAHPPGDPAALPDPAGGRVRSAPRCSPRRRSSCRAWTTRG